VAHPRTPGPTNEADDREGGGVLSQIHHGNQNAAMFGFETEGDGVGVVQPAAVVSEEPAGEPLFAGDLVALCQNGRGGIGYVVDVSAASATIVPVSLRTDGVWRKCGKRVVKRAAEVTKLPATLDGMRVIL
jgi:hypothetical protein